MAHVLDLPFVSLSCALLLNPDPAVPPVNTGWLDHPAALTITHAGLNTVLESLRCGVPMVAIPIANDQPGVAARVAWTGSGAVVPLQRASVPRLRAAIARVWSDPAYRTNAQRLQQAISTAGGVARAADIVEQAINTGQPVL